MDLREALNAISDVVNNRPLPLREFDQIYMKAGDMVVYAELLARKFDGKRLVFVGDGDAVGLALAHLRNEGVIDYGPDVITVLDFDERQVNSINRFAANCELGGSIEARLYNVIDPLHDELLGRFDGFHINPPWGQYNNGESVRVFLQRGVQATRLHGQGAVVIADDAELEWTNRVLMNTQRSAIGLGLILSQMIPELHSYHLDDAPELKSCAMLFRKVASVDLPNARLDPAQLENFYGRGRVLRVRYVRDIPEIAKDQAAKGTYSLDLV